MAKDEFAGMGLDDDEIDLIKARRKQRREEDERVIRIKDEHGREAEVPYSVGRNWLRKHGFDLDDEATAPEPEPEPEPDEDEDKPKGTRFAGRRVS